MRLWPFGKRTEKRQDGTSYTDVVTRALVVAATGTEQGDAAGTAALETAASLYARCFSMTTISPTGSVTAALTPKVLSNVAREMVTRGESMYRIVVSPDGAVKLFPVGSFDIRGDYDPAAWMVRTDLFGPTSSSTTDLIPYSSVLHFQWSFDSSLPWVGVGPASRSSITSRLHGALEQNLGHEVAGPVGSVIPVPQSPAIDDDDDDPLGALRADIRNLKGATALVETVAAAWGEGSTAAPRADWRPSRIGAAPGAALVDLRGESARSVLASCGIPPTLYEAGAAAAGQRESWRQFLHGSLQPVAELIAEEAREKLEEEDFSIYFDRLFASDLMGRARAYGSMVQGGMAEAEAAELAGLS